MAKKIFDTGNLDKEIEEIQNELSKEEPIKIGEKHFRVIISALKEIFSDRHMYFEENRSYPETGYQIGAYQFNTILKDFETINRAESASRFKIRSQDSSKGYQIKKEHIGEGVRYAIKLKKLKENQILTPQQIKEKGGKTEASGCYQSCQGFCTSCQNGCEGSCIQLCGDSCENSCKTSCSGWCVGHCGGCGNTCATGNCTGTCYDGNGKGTWGQCNWT